MCFLLIFTCIYIHLNFWECLFLKFNLCSCHVYNTGSQCDLHSPSLSFISNTCCLHTAINELSKVAIKNESKHESKLIQIMSIVLPCYFLFMIKLKMIKKCYNFKDGFLNFIELNTKIARHKLPAIAVKTIFLIIRKFVQK